MTIRIVIVGCANAVYPAPAIHISTRAMNSPTVNLCAYCGSSTGRRPEHGVAARRFGELCARAGIGLVYGGGHRGLMGQVADAALAAGGRVIGVIPRSLMERELAHRQLTELVVVGSMHERKNLMAERSQGFAALPGGWGTLDELAEMVTWSQLGLHDKPIGLLNSAGYFDGFLDFVGKMRDEEFVARASDPLIIAESPEQLLDALLARIAT